MSEPFTAHPAICSDLQLVELAIPTLFVCDDDGRLRYVHEPGYEEAELDPAPRFFMGRTLEGNLWRFRHDLPGAVVRKLAALAQTPELRPTELNAAELPQPAEAIRAVLQAHASLAGEERGPAYWIPEGLRVPGEAVIISEANGHLLEAHFPWVLTSPSGLKRGPVAAAVADGQAVAICHCARLTPWAAEAGVETVEAFRGRGFAGAAVAAWAAAVRSLNVRPLYSTSWDNAASQAVARKLGLVRFAEYWSIT